MKRRRRERRKRRKLDRATFATRRGA